jgi:hypothetical protein
LATKCPIIIVFSLTDVEQDIWLLETALGVTSKFDWFVTLAPNAFGSEKWEFASFSPRVMVKTNWGAGVSRRKTSIYSPLII